MGVWLAILLIVLCASPLLPALDPSFQNELSPADGAVLKAPESAPEIVWQLKNASYPEGLDRLRAVEGRRSEGPIRVRLLHRGQPAAGRLVSFAVVESPRNHASPGLLTRNVAETDDKGIAATWLDAGDGKGLYLVQAEFVQDGERAAPVFVRVEALSRTWVVMLFIGLFGGLALFLFGMDWAGSNLQKVAGERFRTLLRVLTRNPLMGAILGAVSTFILQSSSASTVMLVGLVSATLLSLGQAVGVIIGAKIGTTFTVQIIAFNISEYALAIVALGLIIRMSTSYPQARRVGKVVMGFGFIFFGMAVMSAALKPLRALPEFNELLLSLSDRPVMAILVSMLFTAVIQSSSATIGVALALAAQGMITLKAGIPIGMGAAIGTCATALLASMGTKRAGKQVAVAHLIYSVLSVALFVPFIPQLAEATQWVSNAIGDTDVVRQIANGFTLFAVGAGVIFLPFTGLIARLTQWVVPERASDDEDGPKYLQQASIAYPAAAIEQAMMETLHMGQLVRQQLIGVSLLIEAPDTRRVYQLANADDKIDVLERAIRPFLTQVAQQELADDSAARERALVYVADALESTGDIIVRSLLHALEKLAERKLNFSDEGRRELLTALGVTISRFDRVMAALKDNNHTMAEDLIDEHEQAEFMDRKSRGAHLERLHKGQTESLASSEAHLSISGALLNINRRITDMARIIRDEMPR